jgi:hypothetical protein
MFTIERNYIIHQNSKENYKKLSFSNILLFFIDEILNSIYFRFYQVSNHL